MSIESWENFNDYLFRIIVEMKAEAFVLTDSSFHELIRPRDYPEYRERLKACIEIIEQRSGARALKKGRASRVINNEKDNPFIAEPLMSSYFLFLLFLEPFNPFQISPIIDREKKAICETIGRLPPLGGGGGIASSKRALA